MRNPISRNFVLIQSGSFSRSIIFSIVYCLLNCTTNNPVNDNADPEPVTFKNGTQLTESIVDKLPRWSLFGQKIAFERNGNVYIIDVQSTTITFEAAGHAPFWSHEGDYLAFFKDGEIYTMQMVPGRPVIKLTLGAYASDQGGGDWNAANRIAYFQEGDSAAQGRKLMVYDIIADSYQHFQTEALGYAEFPSWSPEGRYVLFSSPVKGICLFDVVQDRLNELTPWGVTGKSCWYYPRILFIENGQLFSMDINGDDKTVMVTDNFNVGSMDHSFDREQITFSYNGIWIMDFPPADEE